MEEKDRYKLIYNNEELGEAIIDTEEDLSDDIHGWNILCDLLNQQDKRIKELELLLNADKKMKTNLVKGFEKLKQENQELKLSQKQLAINELNDILKFIVTGSSNYYKPPFEIKKHIEDKIKELKGEE